MFFSRGVVWGRGGPPRPPGGFVIDVRKKYSAHPLIISKYTDFDVARAFTKLPGFAVLLQCKVR